MHSYILSNEIPWMNDKTTSGARLYSTLSESKPWIAVNQVPFEVLSVPSESPLGNFMLSVLFSVLG